MHAYLTYPFLVFLIGGATIGTAAGAAFGKRWIASLYGLLAGAGLGVVGFVLWIVYLAYS